MDRKRKIAIPKDIKPEEFFLRFVPETYNGNVKNYDMSGYESMDLTVQFHITGPDGGEFGLRMLQGTKVETVRGGIPDPAIRYTFDGKHFQDAVNGMLPWIPVDMAFDPEALREGMTPLQAREETEILKGIHGQADIRVAMKSGGSVDARLNFHEGTQPAVVFHVTQRIVEEVKEKKYTVMEAFMASKIKVEGPVEFAMHVMALVPEDEDEDGEGKG